MCNVLTSVTMIVISLMRINFMLHSKHSVFFFHFPHHVNVLILGLIAADAFLAVPGLPFRAAS